MRRLATLVLLSALASPLAAQAPSTGAGQPVTKDAPEAGARPAPVASFAGGWRLDVGRSRDLPPFYAGVREHLLEIAQDDSSLTVDVALVDTAGAATRLRLPYSFRRPVSTTTQVRTPSGPRDIPATLTASPRPDGGLEIDIAREITMGDRTIRPKDRESWRLSPAGELLIDREAEMPGPGGMRTVRAHYVFVRR